MARASAPWLSRGCLPGCFVVPVVVIALLWHALKVPPDDPPPPLHPVRGWYVVGKLSPSDFYPVPTLYLCFDRAIESLFTTMKSMLDIAACLTRFVERRLLKLSPQDRSTDSEIIALPGLHDDQRKLLITVRDRFIHEAPPWFEVIIAENSAPDLVIQVSHDRDYTAGKGYVLLSQVGNLPRAIETHLDAVESFLVERLDRRAEGVGTP